MHCKLRNLKINPKGDCRYCALLECCMHPYHIDPLTLQILLSDCQSRKANRKTSTTRRDWSVIWDGLRTTCRRWRWFKGNRPGDPNEACEDCTLPRECEHRGQRGRNLLEWLRKRNDKEGG